MGEARFPPDLCLDREICRACGFLSTLAQAQDWNSHWIVCGGGCGEAFHRSCAPGGPPLDTPVPHGCNPTTLTNSWSWSCQDCRRQELRRLGRDDAGEADQWIEQCYMCHQISSSTANVVDHAGSLPKKLWSRYHYLCLRCKPHCVSCTERLEPDRALESKWCRRCRVADMQGASCPFCKRSYDSEEPDMIQCDGCSEWVHFGCAGVDWKTISQLGLSDAKFFCFACSRQAVEIKDASERLALRCFGCTAEETGLTPLMPINLSVPDTTSLWCHKDCLLLANLKLKLAPLSNKPPPTVAVRAGAVRPILYRRGIEARLAKPDEAEARALYLRGWLACRRRKPYDVFRGFLRVTYRLSKDSAGFSLAIVRPPTLPLPWDFTPIQAPTLQGSPPSMGLCCHFVSDP